MTVTVIYVDKENILHAVTVTDVTSKEEGETKARKHFEVICEAEGWSIQDFELRKVEVTDTPDFMSYLNGMRSSMPIDPRD